MPARRRARTSVRLYYRDRILFGERGADVSQTAAVATDNGRGGFPIELTADDALTLLLGPGPPLPPAVLGGTDDFLAD